MHQLRRHLSTRFSPSSVIRFITVTTALNGMFNLVHLELHLLIAPRDQELPIMLSALLTLHLEVASSQYLPARPPVLDCLAISACLPTALDESCIKSCSSRLPLLRLLIFEERGSLPLLSFYPTDYASYAAAFPNVTHLEVSMTVPHFIQAILEGVGPVTHKPYWPTLHTLAVQHSVLEVQTIVSAVSRRRDNGHPIQRLLAKHYMPDNEAFREVVELLPSIDTWQYMPPE
ncbi:hypothetical protein FIBSPDRAFT_867283, partial [Athelia psychrophila]